MLNSISLDILREREREREPHFSKIKCLLEYDIILEYNYNLDKF